MDQQTRFEKHSRMTLAVFTVASVAALLLLSEFVARIVFPQINFVQTSAGLFMPNVYRESYGGARNAKGWSFEAEVFTDSFGFRSDPSSSPHFADGAPSIVFLGDSVV